jgi:hypothetical protein
MLTAAVGLFLAGGALFAAGAGASPAPHALQASVTVGSPVERVPHSFFGLSAEYNELPIYEHAPTLFDRFMSLVRPRDGSRLLFRIGGKSADDMYWETPPGNAPRWVFELGPSWLRPVARLVRRNHLGVMLDLNLAVHSPDMAAAFAGATEAALPRGALVGLAVGNEPDLYHHQPRLALERVATTLASTPTDWPLIYTTSEYRHDFRAYAKALRAAVPGVLLDGPDITSSTPKWVSAISNLGASTPQLITMHRYAFSTCYSPSSPFYPTISGLLGQGATVGLVTRLRRALTIAEDHAIPLRITELNSISCGGNRGVANSFATALWAPDALFELMAGGVVGVNWHIRPHLLNAPFHLRSSGFKAEPELYGLALFARMIGPQSTLLAVNAPQFDRDQLKVWAVRSKRYLSVLLINKGTRQIDALLNVTGNFRGRAVVQRLTAPRIDAENGVRFDGQWIGPDALWHGLKETVSVSGAGGVYRLPMSRYSAALVQFRRP